MAGKNLVSPRRLEGLIWLKQADDRRRSARVTARVNKTSREQSLVKVVVVQLTDWQHKHLGRIA